MKIKCTTCKVPKEEKEFSRDSRKPNGRKGACKECINKQRSGREEERRSDRMGFYDSIIG